MGATIQKIEFNAKGQLVITMTNGTKFVVDMPEEEAHVHSFGAWMVSTLPTCITSGIETRVCGGCNTFENRTAFATGIHAYGAWETVKEKSCFENGTEKHTCIYCSYVETKVIEASHDYETMEEILATETKDGHKIYQCNDCSETYTEILYATKEGTAGLVYTLQQDGTYGVSKGTCTATHVWIPNYYNGKRVTRVFGFQNCTSMASITIGNAITTIGYRAFQGCTSLTSVTIGSGVNYIDSDAFSEAPLTIVKFENVYGWGSYYEDQDAKYDISSKDLSDPSKAAEIVQERTRFDSYMTRD